MNVFFLEGRAKCPHNSGPEMNGLTAFILQRRRDWLYIKTL